MAAAHAQGSHNKPANKTSSHSHPSPTGGQEKGNGNRAAKATLAKQKSMRSEADELSNWDFIVHFMTTLRPYFWPDGVWSKVLAFSCFIALGLSKVCNLVGPIFLSLAVDRLGERVQNNNFGTLSDLGDWPWESLCIYAAMSFGGRAFLELQRYLYLSVKEVAYREVATATYDHILGLSASFFVNKKTGAVMRSLDRGLASAATVVDYLFLRLGPTFVEMVVLTIIASLRFGQAAAALCLLGGFVLYVAVTFYLTEQRKRIRARMVKQDNAATQVAMDAISQMDLVKAFSAEQFELQRYADKVRTYQATNYETQATLALLNSTQNLIQSATMLGVMLLAARTVIVGEASVGDFVLMQTYTLQVFIPLSFLGTIYSMVTTAFVDLGNLAGLLQQQPDVQDKPGAKPIRLPERNGAKGAGPRIEFKDVDFGYPLYFESAHETGPGNKAAGGSKGKGGGAAASAAASKTVPGDGADLEKGQGNGKGKGEGAVESHVRRVLHGVSFTIEPNTTTALVGATGSGKSSITRLLFRFYDVDSGQVLVNGQDVRDVQQKSLRSATGLVPQDTALFNDTIMYNLRYGRPSATDEEVMQAAKAAQIHDFISSLELGYNTRVGERGLKLSGGEKQRVAIARMLLKDPPIVVLDESTSALDSVTERRVQQQLDSMAGGRTTIVVAHRLSTIRGADQILVLDQGHVAERGTHAELVEIEGGLYQRLWSEQQQAEAELGAGEPEVGVAGAEVVSIDVDGDQGQGQGQAGEAKPEAAAAGEVRARGSGPAGASGDASAASDVAGGGKTD